MIAVQDGRSQQSLPDAPSQGSWGAIIVIYLLGVLAAATITQAIPIIGDIARHFHGGAVAGWIISSPSLMVAVGALLVGAIIDRVGDKPMLVVGSVIIIAGDLGVVSVDSLRVMMLMRVLEGCGYVFVTVAAIAMLTRITQGPRRNLALTLWSSYIPMSFAIPLLLAAPLANTSHWPLAFTVHALLIGVLVLLALWLTPSRSAPPPLGSLHGLQVVLRTPSLYLLGLTFCSIAFLQTGLVSALPQVLTHKFGTSLAVGASVGTLGMGCKTLGCLLVGPLLNRGRSPVTVAALGVLLTVGCGLALGLALPNLASAVLISSVFFLGSGLIVGLWALVPRAAPGHDSLGAASGLATQITLLGVLFGPPAAFAAVAAGGWLREGIHIVIGGAVILICIVQVAGRMAR